MVTSVPRIRVQSVPASPGVHTITYHGGMSGVPVNAVAAPPRPHAHYQRTEDVEVQRFHVRSARGEIFNNPFTSDQSWFSSAGEYVGEGWADDSHVKYDRHVWTAGTCFGTPTLPTIPDLSSVIADAVAKASIGARGGINKSDVMSYVTVGEWHKTKILHKQVGTALYEFARAAYSRNAGRDLLKAGSNAWLTGRYAVMPTVYELEGAVKFLNRKFAERRTSRCQQVISLPSVPPVEQIIADSHYWFHTIRTSVVSEAYVRSGILYETTAFGAALGHLGLTRPISSVYELTKFSWMLDWWIDIGSWLDAIEPNGSSKTLSAWIGRRVRHTFTTEFISMAQIGGTAQQRSRSKHRSVDGYLHVYVTDTKVRNPWDASVPLLPQFGSGLNWKRSLDVVSLITQKLGYKRGSSVSGIRF